MDLYRPATEQAPPLVLYFHGGGWLTGDKRDRVNERARVLARLGFAVACVQYRFTSQAQFPAQLQDAKAAVRWLRDRGQSLGISTSRVGAWGASAGGYLAAMLGVTAEQQGDKSKWACDTEPTTSDAVQAVVTWFAPFDLDALSRRSPLELKLLPPSRVSTLIGCPDGGDGVQARDASPQFLLHDAAPPFLIMHGDRDQIIPVAQAAAMHARLAENRLGSTLVLVAGGGHEDSSFETAANVGMVASFFSAHLSD